nr:TPA_asm: P4 [Medicago trirhavirus 1]
MGLTLQLLVFLLERFGEHTILIFDIFLILLLIHYFLNLKRIGRLIRYISALNEPLVGNRNHGNPLAFHVALD